MACRAEQACQTSGANEGGNSSAMTHKSCVGRMSWIQPTCQQQSKSHSQKLPVVVRKLPCPKSKQLLLHEAVLLLLVAGSALGLLTFWSSSGLLLPSAPSLSDSTFVRNAQPSVTTTTSSTTSASTVTLSGRVSLNDDVGSEHGVLCTLL
jgi:hypothetical protein